MICPRCGSYNSDDSNRCRLCGMILRSEPEHSYKKSESDTSFRIRETDFGEAKEKPKKESVEIIFAALLIFIIIVIGVLKMDAANVEKKYGEKLEAQFVGTSMEIEDSAGHIHNITIDSEDQVEVQDRSDLKHIGLFKYKYIGHANVKTKMGALNDVKFSIVVPFASVEKSVEWSYDKRRTGNGDEESEVDFDFTKEPTITIYDVMNALNVSRPYEIMYAEVTSISNDYDSIECCVLYREDYEIVKKKWARLEYNYDSETWNWCVAVAKRKGWVGVYEGMAEDYGFEADSQYTDDYILSIAPSFDEIH